MTLNDFIAESNRIESIHRNPTAIEVHAHLDLWRRRVIEVRDLEAFVEAIAGARLRRSPGMDVTIGGHAPPRDGATVEGDLRWLLSRVADGIDSAYETHVQYELLHPFMDGNGRSGRALWAWMMIRGGDDPFLRPFLQTWYYQSLSAAR